MQVECLAVSAERLLQPAHGLEDQPQVVVGMGVGWDQCNRFPAAFRRAGKLTLLLANRSQQQMQLGFFRPALERREHHFGRLAVPLALAQSQRQPAVGFEPVRRPPHCFTEGLDRLAGPALLGGHTSASQEFPRRVGRFATPWGCRVQCVAKQAATREQFPARRLCPRSIGRGRLASTRIPANPLSGHG